MSKREEFTIDEIMQDSMIRLLMKADRVDPIAFEAKLRAIADRGGHAGDSHDVDDELDDDLVKACASRSGLCRGGSNGIAIRP